MSDAFESFWYLGVFIFLLIAYLLGRIYRAAMAGSTTGQLLYILSAADSMEVITHHTQWIFSEWVQMGLFLLPALALARARGTRNSPASLRGLPLAGVRLPPQTTVK
jgi:hypothetical protein